MSPLLWKYRGDYSSFYLLSVVIRLRYIIGEVFPQIFQSLKLQGLFPRVLLRFCFLFLFFNTMWSSFSVNFLGLMTSYQLINFLIDFSTISHIYIYICVCLCVCEYVCVCVCVHVSLKTTEKVLRLSFLFNFSYVRISVFFLGHRVCRNCPNLT